MTGWPLASVAPVSLVSEPTLGLQQLNSARHYAMTLWTTRADNNKKRRIAATMLSGLVLAASVVC